MEFICAEEKQWKEIKTIYMEAFPKRERKPYFALRHSVKTKKAVVMAATEGEQVLGFIVLIPYKDMVMADYLAVSSKVRSRGTGSYIMQNVCRQYKDKKIVLLIERLDDKAENKMCIRDRFTYPTTGYFDAFFYALMHETMGDDFSKALTYEDGIWDTEGAKQAFDIVAKLATYTEKTTPANANDNDFRKNQQLVLDNKALFMPNGNWVIGEMEDAPKADGFEWGFTALPAVKDVYKRQLLQ